eukprot:jgi/Antlo1/1573/2006
MSLSESFKTALFAGIESLPMYEEKIERLHLAIRDIKTKIERVLVLNEQINIFNFKLEALLLSMDEMSDKALQNDENVDSTGVANTQFSVSKIHHVHEQLLEKEVMTSKSMQIQDVLEKVHKVIPDNALYRSNADKLVRFLFANKSGILYEDILRKSGVSKYRCVDILNALMNTDPPIVRKTFDRGFIYKLDIYYES